MLQVNKTYMVKPVHNLRYDYFHMAVLDNLWDDVDSFKNVRTLS